MRSNILIHSVILSRIYVTWNNFLCFIHCILIQCISKYGFIECIAISTSNVPNALEQRKYKLLQQASEAVCGNSHILQIVWERERDRACACTVSLRTCHSWVSVQSSCLYCESTRLSQLSVSAVVVPVLWVYALVTAECQCSRRVCTVSLRACPSWVSVFYCVVVY